MTGRDAGGRRGVLDMCCGSRCFYPDKRHPDVVFCDIRDETITVTDRSHGRPDGVRVVAVRPDVRCDFTRLPFHDRAFDLVVFDPPHLVRAGRGWQAAKYGVLPEDWPRLIRAGFQEGFRVLSPCGTLVFKWSAVQVPLGQVLPLAGRAPVVVTTAAKTTIAVFHGGGQEPRRPIDSR